mgnify:FL=1
MTFVAGTLQGMARSKEEISSIFDQNTKYIQIIS